MMSKDKTSICYHGFNMFGANFIYIGVNIFNITNTYYIIPIVILIFWVAFFTSGSISIITSVVISTRYTAKMVLGISGLIFAVLVASISYGRFNARNLCIMNKNDPFCGSVDTDCFSEIAENSHMITFKFEFGKFIETVPKSAKNSGRWISYTYSFTDLLDLQCDLHY